MRGRAGCRKKHVSPTRNGVGVKNDDHPLAKAYHKLLVWEIMKQPKALQVAGKVLDPVIGKSMVLYFKKPDA